MFRSEIGYELENIMTILLRNDSFVSDPYFYYPYVISLYQNINKLKISLFRFLQPYLAM